MIKQKKWMEFAIPTLPIHKAVECDFQTQFTQLLLSPTFGTCEPPFACTLSLFNKSIFLLGFLCPIYLFAYLSYYGWVIIINMHLGYLPNDQNAPAVPTQQFLPTQYNYWHGYHGHLDTSEDGGSLDHWDDFALTLSLFYSAVCVGFQKKLPIKLR